MEERCPVIRSVARAGDGPAQHVADTPDGTCAQFLRHAGDHRSGGARGVARSLWAFEADDGELADASPLAAEGLLGGEET